MNLVVLCDFDGTITEIDTAEFVLSKFSEGDWRVFDKQFESGKITLEDCLKKEFALVSASEKEILNELRNVVTFRPHFEKLAEYCRKNSIPFIIVSAGLDFVIKHFLQLNGWHELVETYTAKTKYGAHGIEFTFPRLFDKTSANFKQDLVRRCKCHDKTVIYIGDGSGDYAAARDADYPFAIKGSRLASICEGHRMHCRVITDFQEVIEAINKVDGTDVELKHVNTKETNAHHLEILTELKRHAKNLPEFQKKRVESYAGTSKFCYLIDADTMRQIVRKWIRMHSELSPHEYVELLSSLYKGKSHDELCVAGRLLELAPKLRKTVEPHLLNTWLVSAEGWAEVDSTCQSGFSSEELLAKWDEWKDLLIRLASDDNVHKRRASLVLLTKPVRKSEDPRLADLAFMNIEKLKHNKSILITKAISWLLRALIKNHRQRVEAYLDENKEGLPKVALRDTKKKLLTGTK